MLNRRDRNASTTGTRTRGQTLTESNAALCEALEARQLLAVDLVATDIQVSPQTIGPGNDFVVNMSFRNDGDTPSAPFQIQVRLSANPTLGDSDDLIVGTFRRLTGLGAGQSATSTRSFFLPDGTDFGSYYVGFVLDNTGSVAETSEINNGLIDNDRTITVSDTDAGDIEVRGNNIIISDGDTQPSFIDGTAFGRLRADAEPRLHTYTIFNRGSGRLTLFDISIVGRASGSFSIVNQPSAGGNIDPGESVTFQIAFDPSTVGMKRTTVQISSSDSDNSDFSFDIVGTGRLAGVPNIILTGFLPINDGDGHADAIDGTDFGRADVGDSIERTFTITNLGNGDLVLGNTSVRLGGRNPFRFTIVDNPDATVRPGESTQFTIRFEATRPGTMKAIVQVFSNDPDDGVFDFQIRAQGHPAQANG